MSEVTEAWIVFAIPVHPDQGNEMWVGTFALEQFAYLTAMTLSRDLRGMLGAVYKVDPKGVRNLVRIYRSGEISPLT